jgi:hypothetical protein
VFPYIGPMGILDNRILSYCNLSIGITLYKFEGNYDPKYLNLDPNDENSWKIFAEKVRDIMAKCLGAKKVNLGYREENQFHPIYN